MATERDYLQLNQGETAREWTPHFHRMRKSPVVSKQFLNPHSGLAKMQLENRRDISTVSTYETAV
jgi:hypothetical protein